MSIQTVGYIDRVVGNSLVYVASQGAHFAFRPENIVLRCKSTTKSFSGATFKSLGIVEGVMVKMLWENGETAPTAVVINMDDKPDVFRLLWIQLKHLFKPKS